MGNQLFLLQATGAPVVKIKPAPSWPKSQRERALAGKHPANGEDFCEVEGATCGNCEHRIRRHYGGHHYIKCGLLPMTKGPATDIRAGWLGCVRWSGSGSAP